MDPARGRCPGSLPACEEQPTLQPADEREVTMRKYSWGILAVVLLGASLLRAQQPCPRLPVIINTPEDKLMLAVNGADTPQEQVDALTKFAADYPTSRFVPCVNEYLTMTYVKMQDFDKAMEAGEKDLAANYLDVNLDVNLLKAYVGAGKATDNAFDLINKSPQLIHDETISSTSENAAETAKDVRAYVEYAFFQLLPRVTDAAKRVAYLDAFVKAFPDTPNMNQVSVQYFAAYQLAGDSAKMFEYGQKAVAADPKNVSTLNLVADGFATSNPPHLDQAAEYAQKALDLATAMQKPEGMTDDQFKASHDVALGLAHSTLGYVAMQKGAKTHHMADAITELKTASDLLDSNPPLQARALYFLGYSYELAYPANHHLAEEALTKAVSLDTPWKAQARDLLDKVKKAH
jgi:tetratricopeptide (TPR) repeat protein